MQVGARMSQKSDASLLISRFLMMQNFSLLHISWSKRRPYVYHFLEIFEEEKNSAYSHLFNKRAVANNV